MVVAEATLAAEKSLNALNFDMARDLFAAAEEWHTDDSIAAIIISGAGVRAFCAGGDVRQVCVAVADNPQAAGDYFAAEYRADFALHCINKPLLCFAGGIVMGGGVGIMQACNIRIATDTTMLAMPETAIGAIPDVGAARFLRAAFDGGGGFFLGISGAAINGAESQAAGLADYLINDNCRTQLIDRLCETDWQTNADDNKRIAKTLLGELTKTHPPQTKPAPMLQVRKQIAEVATTADAFAVCDNDNNNAFLQTAAKKMRTASPSAMALWQVHFDALQNASLAEVFAADYRMMTGAAMIGDFCEGVRAMLIDKDNAPKWQHDSIVAVPEEWLNAVIRHDSQGADELLQTLNQQAAKYQRQQH